MAGQWKDGGIEGLCAVTPSIRKVPTRGPCSETRGRDVTWCREAFIRDNLRRCCFAYLIWYRLFVICYIRLTPLHALRIQCHRWLGRCREGRRIDFGMLYGSTKLSDFPVVRSHQYSGRRRAIRSSGHPHRCFVYATCPSAVSPEIHVRAILEE